MTETTSTTRAREHRLPTTAESPPAFAPPPITDVRALSPKKAVRPTACLGWGIPDALSDEDEEEG